MGSVVEGERIDGMPHVVCLFKAQGRCGHETTFRTPSLEGGADAREWHDPPIPGGHRYLSSLPQSPSSLQCGRRAMQRNQRSSPLQIFLLIFIPAHSKCFPSTFRQLITLPLWLKQKCSQTLCHSSTLPPRKNAAVNYNRCCYTGKITVIYREVRCIFVFKTNI